ncbi:hypothetical protein Hanom_Chr05g00459741 [Helianthus anomalus]
MRNFLEERGRAVQFGTMVVGSRSPAKPALIWPAPLSRTTTTLEDICFSGEWW